MEDDYVNRTFKDVIVPRKIPSANKSKIPVVKALYKKVGQLEDDAEAVWDNAPDDLTQDSPDYYDYDEHAGDLYNRAKYLAQRADHLNYVLDDDGEFAKRYAERKGEMNTAMVLGGLLTAATAGVAAVHPRIAGKAIGGLAAAALAYGMYGSYKATKGGKDEIRKRALDYYNEKYPNE